MLEYKIIILLKFFSFQNIEYLFSSWSLYRLIISGLSLFKQADHRLFIFTNGSGFSREWQFWFKLTQQRNKRFSSKSPGFDAPSFTLINWERVQQVKKKDFFYYCSLNPSFTRNFLSSPLCFLQPFLNHTSQPPPPGTFVLLLIIRTISIIHTSPTSKKESKTNSMLLESLSKTKDKEMTTASTQVIITLNC